MKRWMSGRARLVVGLGCWIVVGYWWAAANAPQQRRQRNQTNQPAIHNKWNEGGRKQAVIQLNGNEIEGLVRHDELNGTRRRGANGNERPAEWPMRSFVEEENDETNGAMLLAQPTKLHWFHQWKEEVNSLSLHINKTIQSTTPFKLKKFNLMEVDWFCWLWMRERYYNSNLYEADSYLVIINEIWWNWLEFVRINGIKLNGWLRRELGAE